MSRRTLVSLWVALGAATGCTSAPPRVDYRITGGFSGTGDGTSLHLAVDGLGTRTSSMGGPQTVQLDASDLADLKQAISGAQFPSLQPAYTCSSCVDAFRYEVTVVIDGSTYATRVDLAAVYPATVTVKQFDGRSM
jgi:hypothetical protein